jgi:four helix bundle protein
MVLLFQSYFKRFCKELGLKLSDYRERKLIKKLMPKITAFENLNCWKEARILVKHIYSVITTPPFSKDFGLRDQIQRASVSVMTNISEGFSRYHRKESIRFLDFSQSSAAEVKSLLYVAEDLGYISKNEAKELREQANSCQKLVLGLIKHFNK